MRASRVAILALILFTACFFRLVGVRFGEPLTVHPDEHNLVYYAMEAGARNGNPGWFEYPSGMIYISLLIEGLHYLASGAGSPAEFWQRYKESPFPFHLWLRVCVALLGVMGVVAIWLLGKEWDKGKSGVRIRFLAWGGAGLLAVHFLHLRDSHFAAVDIPLTTAITLVLWLLLREFNRETTTIKRLIPSALVVGICCGIKYTAAPLVFPLL
ncbi:MAG: glycosyltransferase family 39 protein, partial [Candidatus Omnitrophica bacterium]|nr:glycosyltransferase family 39 protein [Candidatus Omnitrophota bacterium]